MEVETSFDNYDTIPIPRGSPPLDHPEEQLVNDEVVQGDGCERPKFDSGFAAEVAAYQDINIDYDSEYAAFFSREIVPPRSNNNNDDNVPETTETTDVQQCNRVRRSSSIVSATGQRRVGYNSDGTIYCSEINYDSLVRTLLFQTS